MTTPRPDDFAELRDRAVDALRALVRIRTVSHADPALRDEEPFVAVVAELRRRFPLLHEQLELTPIPGHALLFRWPGRSAARPVVLMAHLDVVPVDDAAPWQHPAWEARVVDGHVWGRGTLDDKGPLVCTAAAVERLLARGFVPAQDVWLSFGTTEEVSGETAPLAVDELERRGVRPWFVVDEGGAVASDAFPGVTRPVGVVGVAEKGTTTIELRVDGRGGHASTPARMDATARVARAVVRLDRSPMPVSVPAPTIELFRRLAPHAPRPLRRLMAGAGSLRPVLARVLVAAGPETAAMARTTVAVTTLSGSPAHNVLASTARAGVNVRVMVGDTVDGVVAHLRRAIHDEKVRVSVVESGEASPVSPVDDDAFRLLERTIGEQFPEAVVAPYVMMAATDARFFTRICPRVYRWSPLRMSGEQRASLHSFDERVGVDDLADGVLWYERLLVAIE
ncbi:MAG: M20/M25/M40 family metallo-hydrolase [Nocardioidaceae bacterium]|nr:M20/M25/M40 family metallo-hydrolase [Nocardioidaceae bacterium]